MSPGEPLHPDDALAIELFLQAERLGWPTVLALRPLRLTRWQREMLVQRLDWLAQYRAAQRQQVPTPMTEEEQLYG